MTTIPEAKSFSLDELCVLVELPQRTVRYYIQLGLVDRPTGETRAAIYSSRHLDQLLTIRKWQNAGLSLDRIGEILKKEALPLSLPPDYRRPGTVEVWSHLVLDEGVELHINPDRAGLKPEQVRRLLKSAIEQLKQIRGDKQ